MNEELNRRNSASTTPRPLVATARERLAQRAMRQLDDMMISSLSGSYQMLPSSKGTADLDHTSPPSYIELESPASLVKKHGFVVDESGQQSADDFFAKSDPNFKDSDELRNLCVVVAESDQKFYVCKEYLGAWSEQFRQFPHLTNGTASSTCASGQDSSNPSQMFHFPGDESQLQLLLSVVCPVTKRFGVDQICDIIKLCSQWLTHESLTDVAAYYLHSSVHVGHVEKLKLVSLCGNQLLLYGTLHHQCKRDDIFNLVNTRSEDYSQIRKGPFASVTISKMLEHAAGDGDLDYKDGLAMRLDRELNAFKRRLGDQLDFSQPDEFRRWELVCDGASFYVSRAYVAAWSPVLRHAFYGDFRERRLNRLRLDGGQTAGDPATTASSFRLFLSLLHPTVQAVALKMLPREYAKNFRCNQWVDDLFTCVFDQNVDRLLEVFKLAHRYQVAHLVDACLLFVELKSDLSLSDKVLMADAYHLPKLMTQCVSKMTSHRVVKRMVSDNEHLLPNLSCNAHRLILDRLLALI